jgi:hypothetical protein
MLPVLPMIRTYVRGSTNGSTRGAAILLCLIVITVRESAALKNAR